MRIQTKPNEKDQQLKDQGKKKKKNQGLPIHGFSLTIIEKKGEVDWRKQEISKLRKKKGQTHIRAQTKTKKKPKSNLTASWVFTKNHRGKKKQERK